MRSRLCVAPIAILALALSAAPLCASVLISELCDPRDNYPTDRFIEIFNSGSEPVDLTNWSLVAVANNVDAYTWPLSGVILPGQALVAGNVTTVTGFTVNFPGAWSTANGNWNGRVGDGARLVNASGSVHDQVVATGTLFENADLVRKPSVTEPGTTYNPAEWTSTAVILATSASPGTHGVTPPAVGPVISNVVTLPAVPLAGDPVLVQAAVVDTVGAITTVSLLWGTAAGSLTNTIPMSPLAPPAYSAGAVIPVQPEGTTVYYRVQATSDVPSTTLSSIASYTIAYDRTIHAVQGESAGSPFAGLPVVTRGVVTARFGTSFVIQDGSGPWSGLWARSAGAPQAGDSVLVRGQVTETDAQGMGGNTLLASGVVLASWPGQPLPPTAVVTGATAAAEDWEGVLVTVANATCTDVDAGAGAWLADDGTGARLVDPAGYAFTPTLGTTYDVSGPAGYAGNAFRVYPRGSGDVVVVADHVAPIVTAVAQLDEGNFEVAFSEPVDAVTAAVPACYTIGGIGATGAASEPLDATRVRITVPGLAAGDVTLAVTGVADLLGNTSSHATWSFPYIATGIPPGYYDSAIGLRGTALRAALHAIIRNHTVVSYDGAWNAYRTTDRKPNGKVWDVYSDVPDGAPFYEYDFEQTGGVGGQEGTGYTREHTWCKNWFGGTVSPMYSDLWIIYPCDTHMNGTRGVYPYADVSVPTFTSLNGSKLGACADTGYAGTVFEPIDAFKGDLARSYFYVATRYFGEDAAWPGGPAMSGAGLLPWANAVYLRWSAEDPVSQKERLRNGAIYALQNNRNPFVDHPEFIAALFDSANSTTGIGPAAPTTGVQLRAAPNPLRAGTALLFELATPDRLTLAIHDVAGRVVRSLARHEPRAAGPQRMVWDGRDDAGRTLPAGLYFARLETGRLRATMRLAVIR